MTAAQSQLSPFSLIGPSSDHLLYPVKPGDTLSRILSKFYEVSYGSQDYEAALKMVTALNPEITNVNFIRVGQVIKMPSKLTQRQVKNWCEAPDEPEHISRILTPHVMKPIRQPVPVNSVELDAYSKLAWLTENYGLLSAPVGTGLSTIVGLTNNQTTKAIQAVQDLYEQYAAGKLTRGQYDYRRGKILKNVSKRMGPAEKFLFKGKTAQEALRINRHKALPANHNLQYHSHRLTRLSKLANKGGLLLVGAGVAAGCHQIAVTPDRHKKNEIFVETVSSSVVGTLASVGLGLLFASTPLGWVAILTIGTTATLGSYVMGKASVMAYNLMAEDVDLVNLSGIDSICR